ncbi:hypothetical protein [Clostridium sp.]|uniref:hypothetical protein n=1 Tax=Clostridium sp. TaxID=1506 RepID=UPI001A60371F|nr:hypothetical protein [Clostridium sp.]MBK5243262.1 hypothetical protein [Clostridium sp.]
MDKQEFVVNRYYGSENFEQLMIKIIKKKLSSNLVRNEIIEKSCYNDKSTIANYQESGVVGK